MSDFINTIDALGDDAVFDSIMNRTITEFKDDKVNIIGSGAFHGCQSLTTVDLPNATKAYNLAFAACNALTDVNLPLLTGISDQMFRNCKGLKTISLPGLTGSTGYLGFGDNPLLESVNVPLATEVGTYSFQGCTALKQIDLPSVKKICSGGLQCHNLVTIVLRYNGVCTLENTNAIGNKILNGTGYIYVPTALIDSYKADSVWSTYANQFRKLEEWTVDGTVTGAFDANRHMVRFFGEDGTLLGYVIVPTGGNAVYPGAEPTKEGEWAFKGWSPAPTNVTADMDCYAQFKSTAIVSRKLVEGTIDGAYANNVVTNIGDYAFYGCSNLATVDFPAATSISQYAFNSCSKLTALILRNTETVVTLSNTNAFKSTPITSGAGYIYVPATLVDSYKSATNWSGSADKIRAIEDYPDICGGEV
jgi:hypothetical protein